MTVQVIHYTGSVGSSYTSAEALGAISSVALCQTFGLAEVVERTIQIDFSKETLELLRYPPGAACRVVTRGYMPFSVFVKSLEKRSIAYRGGSRI